jgi:two-component system, chemotaxis family, chemotaxis protein CheY
MPLMDGLEFLKQVRDKTIYDNMIVLMVTAETEASQVVQALEFGANEYVMKPFTHEVIADKLSLLGFELT